MQLCYVDESGKAETLTLQDRTQQPVFVIAGITLPEEQLTSLTHGWIAHKAKFSPGMLQRGQKGWLDGILTDPKGANLRRGFRSRGTYRQRKHAIGFVDGALRLLERHDARILGRIWVKQLGVENVEMKMHSSSLQFICAAFHAGLGDDERGIVIVDSQTHRHNHQLAHSMFTQRFGRKPPHERLVDMPVFGHSDNHAGLQLADIVCSAVLAPIACAVYAGAYESWNNHCNSGFLDIRERFGSRLRALTYDWHNAKAGKDASSIVVDDPIGRRPTTLMWEAWTTPPRKPDDVPQARKPPRRAARSAPVGLVPRASGRSSVVATTTRSNKSEAS